MSQSKSDNRKPLLTNGDNSHPDSSRSTSVDIGRRDKDVTDGPVVPAPPAGCAARMHAYKACLFVMCTMTGVSIVYGGFSAVVAVFLHEQLGLPERWATFAVNMFGYVRLSWLCHCHVAHGRHTRMPSRRPPLHVCNLPLFHVWTSIAELVIPRVTLTSYCLLFVLACAEL